MLSVFYGGKGLSELKVNDELREKAFRVIQEAGGRIATGHGMSRRELRALERAGVVRSKLMMNETTRSWIRVWSLIKVSEGLINE